MKKAVPELLEKLAKMQLREWLRGQGKGNTSDFLVGQDGKTLTALLKTHLKKRFAKDVAVITAYKLLTR
jgi:hypothetical protein